MSFALANLGLCNILWSPLIKRQALLLTTCPIVLVFSGSTVCRVLREPTAITSWFLGPRVSFAGVLQLFPEHHSYSLKLCSRKVIFTQALVLDSALGFGDGIRFKSLRRLIHFACEVMATGRLGMCPSVSGFELNSDVLLATFCGFPVCILCCRLKYSEHVQEERCHQGGSPAQP